MFWITAGHANLASATCLEPDRLCCWGKRVVNWDNLFSGNVVIGASDTKFLVTSLNDIQFVFWFRTNCKLMFEGNQFGCVKFALNQLILGVFYGVCGRLSCLNCVNGEHLLCKLNSVTSMKCFNFSIYSQLPAHFVFRLAILIATLKWNQLRNINFSDVFWR